MAFFECEFPTGIGYGRVGGSAFSTNISEGFSGDEQRNRNWALSRAKWKINLRTPSGAQRGGTTLLQFAQMLDSFFRVVGARADAFRFKDHLDFQATNQALATVNGQVQLVKNYVIGGRTYQRVITKPITSSVVDYKGNALPNTVFLTGTTDPVTVDYTTGIVTGQSAGTAVDFQFHVPVRFDSDELPLMIDPSNVGGGNPIVSLSSFDLMEVRPPNY